MSVKINSNVDTIHNVEVEKAGGDRCKISWDTTKPEQSVTIFSGTAPDNINKSKTLAVVKNADSATIDVPAGKSRVYYELVPDQGAPVIAALRCIDLEGAFNFRDMGGYPTAGSRHIKWGQVFRSDGLAKLTDNDLETVGMLGIQTVLDFRSTAEVERSPDRLPEGGSIRHVHLAVQTGELNFVNAMERLAKGDADWLTPDYMIQGYIRNIEQYGYIWAKALEAIGIPANRPLVFHCTGGKDRAGTCAALLLLALCVDEDTVVEDHQLSNSCIAPLLPRVFKYVESQGVDPQKVKPYFSAPLDCITALIEHLKTQYGSAEDYLVKKAGLPSKALENLRESLLE